jgi:hypothetical protein
MSILVCKQKPCQEKEIVEKVVVKVFQGIGFASFHTASFTFVANISSEAHRGQSFSHFVLGNPSEGVKKFVFFCAWPFQDGSLSGTLECRAS